MVWFYCCLHAIRNYNYSSVSSLFIEKLLVKNILIKFFCQRIFFLNCYDDTTVVFSMTSLKKVITRNVWCPFHLFTGKCIEVYLWKSYFAHCICKLGGNSVNLYIYYRQYSKFLYLHLKKLYDVHTIYPIGKFCRSETILNKTLPLVTLNPPN